MRKGLLGGKVAGEMGESRLRIAFLGSRGIPACYSGFETFYENLGSRLVARGHEVTVYNRSHFVRHDGPSHLGIRLVTLPTIRTKHLETLVHTFLSVLHAATQHYDIVYVCTVGNSPLCALARVLTSAVVVLNVDGNDWDRPKWGVLARSYIRMSMRFASRFAREIVVDSEVMRSHAERVLGHRPTCLPYGANVGRSTDARALAEFGLEPDEYLLFVGRLVPCNGVEELIQAYGIVQTDKKLVIVGDAPYVEKYKRELRRLAAGDPRIVFTGYRFGEEYRSLSSHAHLFVLPSVVQGTRPVLLDQMGFGNCVLVPDSEANVETIGDAGETYDAAGGVESLARRLEDLLASPERVKSVRERAIRRITEHYEWELVTDRYERFFGRLANRNGAAPMPGTIGQARPVAASAPSPEAAATTCVDSPQSRH